MSTPEASGTRQRTRPAGDDESSKTSNPASLSANPDKKVPRNKPAVKPPLADVSMNRFLLYLVLTLLAIAGFYTWRFTVWAAEVGGYWNLVTGHRTSPVPGAAELAAKAKAVADSGKAATPQGRSSRGKGKDSSIQSQIYDLAASLGVKPADLNAAIRPLVDPSAPNPAEAARLEVELLRKQVEASQGAAAGGNGQAEESGAGLLGVMGEVLLD
ncbi:hypothetical protein EHS25_003395 [Saitozyma podzolica]|uniref:Uncharacterized protein n=1 Tax=Saitozyma podzolica TaxID=1890683 RepID=A0A427Y8W1_9TREE|nr:hypothetical protein EHS25_003395 [Saitozyma podzolica]